MAITYTWSINQLECYPTYQSEENVVFKVSWSYRGKDANGVGSSRGGVADIVYNPQDTFIPYNDLTEAEVLGWVQAVVTADQITEMEAGISGDITWQIDQASANNPVSPPIPWPNNIPEPAAVEAPVAPAN